MGHGADASYDVDGRVADMNANAPRATHVDATPVSLGGAAPKGFGSGKVVTSGDVVGLFQ